ncbi:hypothetical protein GCM10023143_20730 [Compostibacter hankyongensis]|uniref:Glycosyl transferase family 1 domain-containing protein n=2 Tax=Compostibacter hankyongensis TaxID=1007089 RepID=A0ABP8FV05_9BACT
MARETQKLTSKRITVTPFGIDLDVFKPLTLKREETNIFTIGTVKTLEEKYGIRYLIEAFYQLKKKFPHKELRLLIVGGGSQENELKTMTQNLGISNFCSFTGAVPFREVPYYHNLMDISVFLSILDSESFGVSVLEASSVEKAVVVSNVGGLPEVVEDGTTGLVVPAKNAIAAAEAMEKLILNSELRVQMGKSGRKRVEQHYNWKDCILQMKNIYKELLLLNK